MSEPEALVCGFADEASTVAGVAWRLAGQSGALLARAGETIAADAELADTGKGARAELSWEGQSCTAELTPQPAAAELRDTAGEPGPGEPSAAICRASVELSGEKKGPKIDCAGHLTRWAASPSEGAEVLRHLTLPAPDGGLIVMVARRLPGANGHDAEQAPAWLIDAEGNAGPYAEALLSTQYDQAGLQTRAGLELWPGDNGAPALRAAGKVAEGQAAEAGAVTAALLHTSSEGTAGLGSYLIWRS